MAKVNDVKVLNHCLVAPPTGSVPSTSLPLTFFDIPWLLCPPMQRLFFYESTHPTHHFIQTILPTLIHSLSLTLQHFFPFAANLICPPKPHSPHILYVDGDSVPFTVSESTANFNHLTADYPRDVRDLHSLVPELPLTRALEDGTTVAPLMAIQVTILPHSGFSIGIIFRHEAADGRAFHHFIKSWASICRTNGCLEESTPLHNRAEVKDSNNLLLNFLEQWRSSESKEETGITHSIPEEKVRATIVLGRAQIQKLKHWATFHCKDKLAAQYISTFVVTCALIWVCSLKSEEEREINSSGDDNVCYFVFVADCRNRYEISLPSTYFGNCLAVCIVALKRRELVGESGMVQAIEVIGNKIKELERGALRGAERWILNWEEAICHHLVTVAGSPKLGVYQTDFGWGRPKKSEVVHIGRSGVISLTDCRDEEGAIEVGIALPIAQMDYFNSILKNCLDKELL